MNTGYRNRVSETNFRVGVGTQSEPHKPNWTKPRWFKYPPHDPFRWCMAVHGHHEFKTSARCMWTKAKIAESIDGDILREMRP